MYTVSFTEYADVFECADRADVSVEEMGHIYSSERIILLIKQ